jgi:hypothetical protein
MKRYSKYFALFIIVAVILFSSGEANACAMCKETGDGSTGFSNRSLNLGILYLMVIPYIAFSLLAYFWYKASKKQKEQEIKIAEVLKGKVE